MCELGMNVCKECGRYIWSIYTGLVQTSSKTNTLKEHEVWLRPNQVLCHWIHLYNIWRNYNLLMGSYILFSSSLVNSDRAYSFVSYCLFHYVFVSHTQYHSYFVLKLILVQSVCGLALVSRRRPGKLLFAFLLKIMIFVLKANWSIKCLGWG